MAVFVILMSDTIDLPNSKARELVFNVSLIDIKGWKFMRETSFLQIRNHHDSKYVEGNFKVSSVKTAWIGNISHFSVNVSILGAKKLSKNIQKLRQPSRGPENSAGTKTIGVLRVLYIGLNYLIR